MTGAPTRRYRITVRGSLREGEAARAFDGMAVEHDFGETTLVGEFRDQSQLYGAIDRVRDLGLELLRVEEASEEEHERAR